MKRVVFKTKKMIAYAQQEQTTSWGGHMEDGEQM